jgi:hypothetical protein
LSMIRKHTIAVTPRHRKAQPRAPRAATVNARKGEE